MLTRRHCLLALAASSPSLPADSPILDLHWHLRPAPNANLPHLDGAGISKAVLLTPVGSEEAALAELERHPQRFTWFAAADVRNPASFAALRAAVSRGARGFGEIKSPVAVDSPPMRQLYQLAAELGVPVLLHFQEVSQPGSPGTFNTPFSRLEAMLAEYPKTTFIGHADAFWAHISASVPPDQPYPAGKVKPGGLTDRLLAEYPNLYADLSANSGRNALTRDPNFTPGFLERHQDKLLFGSDCSCRNGQGAGQRSPVPALQNKCVARETLSVLRRASSPAVFRKLVWDNAHRLLRLPGA